MPGLSDLIEERLGGSLHRFLIVASGLVVGMAVLAGAVGVALTLLTDEVTDRVVAQDASASDGGITLQLVSATFMENGTRLEFAVEGAGADAAVEPDTGGVALEGFEPGATIVGRVDPGAFELVVPPVAPGADPWVTITALHTEGNGAAQEGEWRFDVRAPEDAVE